MKLSWILFLTLLLAFVNSEELEEKEKVSEDRTLVDRKLRGETNPEERKKEEQKVETDGRPEGAKLRAEGNPEEGKVTEGVNTQKGNSEQKKLNGEPKERSSKENKTKVERNFKEISLRGEGNLENESVGDKKVRGEAKAEEKKIRGEGNPETESQEEGKIKQEGTLEERKLKKEGNPEVENPKQKKLSTHPEERKLTGESNTEDRKFVENPQKSTPTEEGNSVMQNLTLDRHPEALKLNETEKSQVKTFNVEQNPEEKKLGRTRNPKVTKLRGGGNPDESKLREKGKPEVRKPGREKISQQKPLRKDGNPIKKNSELKKLREEERKIGAGGKLREEENKGERKFEEENSGKSKLKTDAGKPNIVFIVADDLGWDDVSFHGSDQIPTPNIDTLAYQGIILQQYYTDTLGTASRSALFTGKYPSRLGTQSVSIQASEDRGIPVSEKLLPEYLKQLGYTTHLVGKWHVGKSRQIYLPTNRGFDSFYGFLGGSVDYYTYNLIENMKNTTSSFYGLDFFENVKPVEGLNGHLTDILTDRAVEVIRAHNKSSPLYLHMSHAAPHTGGALVSLQAPVEFIAANEHIAHSARRHYAGLVTSLDKSVGRVVAALAEREMLENTIIIFISDNGAPTAENFGSNLPLRGTKDTPWEGGARSIALLWNPLLNGGIWRGLFHVTDWMPTLVTAAGGNVNETVDGVNQWTTLTAGGQPRRNEVLVTIDDVKGWAAFREGDFKLIVGELQNETSRYQGLELQTLRNVPPAYERALLESETWRVLKETTDIVLDVDAALAKRNRSNLLLGTIPVQDVVPCVPTRAKGCLYNISEDPLEAHDLWDEAPEIVKRMSLRLRSLWAEQRPRGPPKQDLRADPTKHDYVWIPWVADDEPIENSTSVPPFPLAVSMGELQYLVDLNLNIFRQRTFDAIKNMGSSFLKSVGGLFNF